MTKDSNFKITKKELILIISSCTGKKYIDDSEILEQFRLARNLLHIFIIWKEVNRIDDLKTIIQEISLIADVFIEKTVSYSSQFFERKYGVPIGNKTKKNNI